MGVIAGLDPAIIFVRVLSPVWMDRRVKTAHDDRCRLNLNYAALIAGTGSAVTDLIFSIAKRDVTFFSATAPISFL